MKVIIIGHIIASILGCISAALALRWYYGF